VRCINDSFCTGSCSVSIRRYFLLAVPLVASCFVALCETEIVFGMHDFGNRLEGTQIHNNALDDLKLIAFHRRFVPFSPNAELGVRFFVPPSKKHQLTSISIEASELRDFQQHYFMQSKEDLVWKANAWNTFGPWPTRDVIDKLSISPANLGVLATYRREKSQPVYMPVDVYTKSAGLNTSSPSVYTFYILIGLELQSISVSVANKAGRQVTLHSQQLKFECDTQSYPDCSQYAAGTTQAFDLDLTDLKDGVYDVMFTATLPFSTRKVSLDVPIYQRR
jgi:hypothetical protein